MASVKKLPCYLLASLAWSFAAQAQDLPSELTDKQASKAFQEFWRGFDQYEHELIKEGKEKYERAWERLRELYKQRHQQITDEQLERLESSANRYKTHLRDHPNASNRPYVLLNLAQILALIGDVKSESSPDQGSFERQEALSLLRTIATDYPAFAKLADSLYLRAQILEQQGNSQQALAVWTQLSKLDRTSIYQVYAYVAIGDLLFQQNNPADAAPNYEAALKLTDNLDLDNADYEKLRIEYRLAWAAYRSARLELAIKMSQRCLSPARAFRNNEQRTKIQKDTVEIAGDSIFELDDFSKARNILGKKDLESFAPAIGSRTLANYSANNIHDQVVRFGDYLISKFPLSEELPNWHMSIARSEQALAHKRKEISHLEKLAMLLPRQSLWRSKHKDNTSAIARMEELALNAGIDAAQYYYGHGVSSGNANSFMTAAAIFEILINHQPNHEQANEWRTKYAHAHYFAGRLEEASELYSELKNKYKLAPSTLEISSYQLVLTKEKQWRQAFEEALTNSKDPTMDSNVLMRLGELEKSVHDFANRFPDNERAVDLLLVAAAANRDHDRYQHASSFWERVLVSNPRADQRAMAVRGLVFAALAQRKNKDVIALTKRFLRLEDWATLGSSLGEELRGVLSTAALDQSQELNKSGQVHDAGVLLVKVAQEFSEVPSRAKIYRDGAYLLAIAGDWASAQIAAEQFEKESLNQYNGDIRYLLARAHEYQMRFQLAAETYLSLGQDFPNHSRAIKSLKRAERLALAEDNYILAGASALLLGERLKDRKLQLSALERAISFYSKTADQAKALAAAQKRRTLARSNSERVRSDLMIANAQFATGAEKKALAGYEQIARRTQQNRNQMDEIAYASVYGEANYRLAQEAKKAFDDFDIFARAGSLNENVRKKTDYFEQLVKKYDAAAASNHPEWAPRARYELAESAEHFADDLASIPVRAKQTLADRTIESYKNTAERLRRLAKKYYSSNLLARNRSPQQYKNNVWMKKSALKLTGYGDAKFSTKHQYSLPTAINMEMPQQWSH